MKKNKLTLDSFYEMLREKEIFDISEVEYALLENSGKLSVLRMKEYRPLNLHELNSQNKPPKPSSFPIELIKEGKFIYEHL
ncbi:YetF domain-containing protein [Paenibacillus sp. MMO-58]|uniref:YetF domain-containing protein n=1 Tax=Paenibacillus sp. MMO-58 TaxID=3081290 RepID=UPI00301918AC